MRNLFVKFVVTLASLFAVETFATRLMHSYGFEESIEALLVAFILTLAMGPLIYLMFGRRLNMELTEKTALIVRLEKLNKNLITIRACNEALIRAEDEKQLLGNLCRVITEAGGYRMTWIGFAENDEAKTVKPVASTGYEAGYLEKLDITWADAERGRGPTGTAIRANKPVVCRDIATDPLFSPWRAEALKRGYSSSVALPLTDGEAVIGALNIYSKEADAFDAEEMSLLTELANDLSFGIIHLRMRKKRESLQRESDIRNKISGIFLTVPDDEMYADVLRVILDAMDSRYGLFGYINEEGDLVCPSMTRDVWEKCNMPEKDILFPRNTWGGLWGRSLLEKRTLYSNTPFHVPEGHIQITRSIATPVVWREKVIGFLHIANKETDYGETDVELLEMVAQHIAPVLSARLERQRHEAARKKAEEFLKKSEARLNAAQQLAHIGGWEYGVETQTSLWTDELYRIHDLELDEVGPGGPERIAKSLECYDPDDRPVILAAFQQCAQEGKPYDLEFPFTTFKGRKLWIRTAGTPVFDDGKVVKVIGYIMDITERKRMENILISKQGELSKAQQIAHLGNWERDLRTDKQTWSDELYRIYGFEPGAFEPTVDKFMELVHSEDRKMIEGYFPEILSGKLSRVELDFRIIRPDGQERIIHDKMEVITDKDNKPVKLIGVNLDITERKKWEKELIEANQKLQQALDDIVKTQKMLIRQEKLAAMGQLSAGVAHELKNPLNIISTSAQIMMMEEGLPAEAMQSGKIIMEQVMRAVKIIDNLRDFARERKPERREIVLCPFIEKTISLVAYEMRGEGIEIEQECPPAPIQIMGDEDQLAQVFLNIITNARDSLNMRKKSYSFAEAEKIGWKARLSIRTLVEDGKVKISFEDNGIGISEENKRKLFTPFFTTKGETKGTGLGMAIAFGIIENHGGTIEFESEEGKGAVFTVTIPLAGM